MQVSIQHQGARYTADLQQPIDISIPLREGTEGVNCFYAPLLETSPVVAGDFVGSTSQGGPLNFLNVRINPHGNGTHTECVGHIAKEAYSLNQCLKKFHFFAKLVSVYPTKTREGDRVITREQMTELFQPGEATAIIIRSLPNDDHKLRMNYSGTNPPFIHHLAIQYLVDCGVEHLLIDLPSLDREEDGGNLLSHKAFWQYPDDVRKNCTISELIYVPNEIKDGLFLLNLQIASFEIDVSPSKVILFHANKIHE
ncbi:MAG: cyclase family protein [Bacteroidota bacterium]